MLPLYSTRSMARAILLDRDGVINRERPDYVKSWDEFELLPGVLLGLKRLSSLGYPILVISNQSAIGRNHVTADTVDAIHRRLQELVEQAGGRLDAFFVCPHRPDENCQCRKPKPGLLYQAAARYDLTLQECIFVGDSVTDYQAALAAGCESILLETGRQGLTLRNILGREPRLWIAEDFSTAVSRILCLYDVDS